MAEEHEASGSGQPHHDLQDEEEEDNIPGF
jgi:hypothetical protein